MVKIPLVLVISSNFFSIRAINAWNQLPNVTISAKTPIVHTSIHIEKKKQNLKVI